MENDAICKKVSSMLSLYIDNKVAYQERAFIEDHISNCDECYKKFLYLKSLIKNLKDSYKQVVELALKKQKQNTFSIREHEKFMENISPYVDNELEAQECFEFRKYLIKSKMAQKELKNTYLMQKEMRTAFEKTKKTMSPALSNAVMDKLRNKNIYSFKTKVIKGVFNKKTAKVAILSGLVFFGAYELKHLSMPVKPKVEQSIAKPEEAKVVKKTHLQKINRKLSY